MKNFDKKKIYLKEKISQFLLSNGVRDSSLRNIADACGTSDRMLLHYFSNKEEIMSETLLLITENFIDILKATGDKKFSLKEMIDFVKSIINENTVRPYINLFLELISLAGAKIDPYFRTAQRMGKIFYSWIENTLHFTNEENKDEIISYAFILIEGIVVLNALNFNEMINKSVDYLSREV